jgi:DNA-directed RNA polymerase I, II, and III subunit RPABC2
VNQTAKKQKKQKQKQNKDKPTNKKINQSLLNKMDDDYNDDDDDNEEDDENYLHKFDDSIRKNIVDEHYPEMIIKNNEEIETLSRVVRDDNGNIIDPYHKTLPFLTKYEKARILGERANQINDGSAIFVQVEPDVIDGYLIALKEFEEKKIPFIIQRPLPNGNCEYWRVSDLEII